MSFVAAGITAAEVAAAIAAAEAAAVAAAEAAAVTAAETAAAAGAEAAATEAAVVVPEAIAESSAQEVVKDVGSEGIKDLAAEAPKSPQGGIGDLPVPKPIEPPVPVEPAPVEPVEPVEPPNIYERPGPREMTPQAMEDAQAEIIQNEAIAAEKPPIPVEPQPSPFNNGTKIGRMVEVAPKEPPAPYMPDVPPANTPFNSVGGTNPALNVSPAGETAVEPGVDVWAQSIADKGMTSLDKAGEWAMDNKLNIALGGLAAMQMMPPDRNGGLGGLNNDMIRPYTYSEEDTSGQEADPKGREKIRYSSSYAASAPYKAAQGGLLSLHRGGNFLSGGGDGMSDDIPAMIGTKQPARLADGEFVIPADVVSHIGNGSSKAGAEKLYAMMDKIRQERTGRKRQSPQIKAEKYLPR